MGLATRRACGRLGGGRGGAHGAGVAGLYWGFGAVITLNAIPYLWVAY